MRRFTYKHPPPVYTYCRCRAHTVGNLSRMHREQRTALRLQVPGRSIRDPVIGEPGIGQSFKSRDSAKFRALTAALSLKLHDPLILVILRFTFTLLLRQEFTHRKKTVFPLSSGGRLSAPTKRFLIHDECCAQLFNRQWITSQRPGVAG